MLAKSPIIPVTFPDFTIWINMQVHALCVRAFAIVGKEPTLWHLFQIVFVKKLAVFALFTQSTQPVLTHYRFLGFLMLELAVAAVSTLPA
jgi:hypothetical protein